MPNVVSFVLRFTQPTPTEAASTGRAWYGLLRHVETNEQIHFTRIEEALAFLGRYVDLQPAPPEDAVSLPDPKR